METYFTQADDFELEGSFSKAELIGFIEQLDDEDAPKITIIEVVLDEGTSRDVTTDIAREMVDATEWTFDRSGFNDYRDTPLCAFILEHAEDYADEVFSELKREAA